MSESADVLGAMLLQEVVEGRPGPSKAKEMGGNNPNQGGGRCLVPSRPEKFSAAD